MKVRQSKESKAHVAALKNVSDPTKWAPKPVPQPAPAKPEPNSTESKEEKQ